jgi:hypothetical protein
VEIVLVGAWERNKWTFEPVSRGPSITPQQLPPPMQEIVAVTSLVGALVEQAEETILELQENPDLLGTAIIRKCQECADGLEHVANELELEERNIRSTTSTYYCSNRLNKTRHPFGTITIPIITFDEIVAGTIVLMRDISTSLREIGEQDANEIGEVV